LLSPTPLGKAFRFCWELTSKDQVPARMMLYKTIAQRKKNFQVFNLKKFKKGIFRPLQSGSQKEVNQRKAIGLKK